MVNRFAPRVQGGSNFGAIAQATGSLLGSAVGGNSQTSRLYSQQKLRPDKNKFAGRVNASGGWREMDQGLQSSLRSWESAGQAMGQSAGSALKDMFGGGSAAGAGGGGAFTNVNAIAGGNLANAQGYINDSATRNGIPPNLLAAFIARESTGDWNRDGSRRVFLPDRGHYILPYAGMTDPAIRRVGMDPGSLVGNQQGQIEAAARLIRQVADNEAKGYGWEGVANVFYSGDPTGGYTPGDSFQYGTTSSYTSDIMKFWNLLEPGGANSAISAGSSAAGNQFGGISSMSTVWGGSGERDLSYGFNAPNDLGLYGYGTSYGMNGRGHTGIDIPMNIGEATYTPVSGTVVCACTGNGSGAEGNGCGAFNDVMGRGCGRIEVKLDNGHTVIFGHMSTSNVKVGQRVNAGQAIGGAGGMNGGHVHLEYRIPDPSTPSGWRIVDPSGFVSGSAMGASAAGAAGGMDQMPYNPNVPWQGWKGRQIGQTQFAQAGYRPVSSWRL